jgi:hypothetical protein
MVKGGVLAMPPIEFPCSEYHQCISDAEHRFAITLEQEAGSARGVGSEHAEMGAYCYAAQHASEMRGVMWKSRLWRNRASRGRAGQAFAFGEVGVVDRATANS